MAIGFSTAVGKFGEKTKVASIKVMRGVALDLSVGAFMLSPVKDGPFRASWRIALNAPDLSEDTVGYPSDPGHGDPPVPEEKAKLAIIATYRKRDQLYITNSRVYAARLDEGWSQMAPTGITKPVIRFAQARFNELVNRVKNNAPFGFGVF